MYADDIGFVKVGYDIWGTAIQIVAVQCLSDVKSAKGIDIQEVRDQQSSLANDVGFLNGSIAILNILNMKQSSNTFICGLDDAGLLGFLSRIAPQCSQCHYPKMEVCIERCCDTNALYCRQCQRDLHFLHRTNDIRMLFVNKSLLSNSEVLVEQLLTSLLEELTLRSLFVENLINSLVSLAQLYNRNIKDAQERLDLARERRWHTPLYATVGNFISGKLGVEQTRKKAMESFSKMQFHDLPLQLPSLRETVRYLTGLSKDMKNVSVEVEPFKKFFEWTVPKNNFQNVMTDTAYEQFVPQNQLPFSIATSNNRSLIVNAADLKTECVLAKRVKIIGGLPNTQAQLINLASLLPATLELELSFFPKTFPENLKKLVLLNISDRISDQKNCELPQSLVMVRYQTKKDNLDSSTQIVARLAELKNLRAVDLALQGYSWKGLRNAIQMGRQLQLMRLSLANNSAIWGSFESGKRYERHFSLIRQAYTRSLFQVCLMHRSESIQRLCSPFREALLETLEFEKKAK